MEAFFEMIWSCGKGGETFRLGRLADGRFAVVGDDRAVRRSWTRADLHAGVALFWEVIGDARMQRRLARVDGFQAPPAPDPLARLVVPRQPGRLLFAGR